MGGLFLVFFVVAVDWLAGWLLVGWLFGCWWVWREDVWIQKMN